MGGRLIHGIDLYTGKYGSNDNAVLAKEEARHASSYSTSSAHTDSLPSMCVHADFKWYKLPCYVMTVSVPYFSKNNTLS